MFDSAVIVGGGRDNQIHGNYFESNDFDILFGNRGNTWQAKIAWCVTHFTVHEFQSKLSVTTCFMLLVEYGSPSIGN